MIVHKTDACLLLCYVDHHDEAYRWAERRVLETHPRTGAAQLVEVRERVKEITTPRFVEVEKIALPKPFLYAGVLNDELLGYGVPTAWLDEVRKADEDTVLELAAHLPSDAAEALLNSATGITPRTTHPIPDGTDPCDHPHAQRRFRVMNNFEELARAREKLWEKSTVFLPPAQRRSVGHLG